MITEFIERRFQSNYDWQSGNCYWFAVILTTQFPELKIYHLPILGHFVAGDGEHFYDSRGEITLDEEPELLDDIKTERYEEYKRLMRDCKE